MTSKTDLLRTPPLDGNSIPRPAPAHIDTPLNGTPTAYHVSFHTQVCSNCHSYHSFNHVSLSITGAKVRVFRPISRFTYRLPIFVHHNEVESVPACRGCAEGLSLSHLLPPPVPISAPASRLPNWKARKVTPQTIMTSNDLEF